MLKKIIFLFIILQTTYGFSQDGATYSEEEIKLQSDFLNAKISLFKGDTIEATKALNKLLRSSEKDAAAFQLSQLYFAQKDLSESLKYGLKVNGNIAKEEGFLLHILNLYRLTEDKTNYQSTLQSLNKNYPENHGYFYNLIDDYIVQKEYKTALNLLTNKQKERGVREEIVKRKYDIYMSQKKNKKAEKELQSLITKYPSELAYRYNLASFYQQTDQVEKAKSSYKQILQLNPGDKTAIAMLETPSSNNKEVGMLQGMIPIVDNPTSNVDNVIKRLLPYLDNNPKNENEEINNTILLLCSKMAVSHPDNAKANTIYGDMLYMTGDLIGAKNQYIKTLDINKSVFAVWSQLFSTMNRLKEYESLSTFTSKAMNYYPNQASIYIYHSIANAMMKNETDAKESLEEAKYMMGKADNITKQNHKIAQISLAIMSTDNDNAKVGLAEFEKNKDNLSYEILEKVSELFMMIGDQKKSNTFLQLSIKAGNPYLK